MLYNANCNMWVPLQQVTLFTNSE